MSTLVQFLVKTESVVYALAFIFIFFSIRGLVVASQTRRLAVFGLEREAAQQRASRSVAIMVAMALLSGGVYIMAHIVAPNMSGAIVEPTPTPLVFVTQVPTPTEARLLYPTITPTPGLPPGASAGTPSPSPASAVDGCEIVGARITEPTPGQAVSGQVTVKGQTNILDFAQYKFEIKGPSTNGSWVVVGTFNVLVVDGFLGTWDSTSLIPGNYTLRLVISRVDGTFPTPCEVPIIVGNPFGATVPAPTP